MTEALAPPMWEGILWSLGIYVLSAVLHVILPGAKVKGYARNEQTNDFLSYKLNGLLVTVISLTLLVAMPVLLKEPVLWKYTTTSDIAKLFVASAASYHPHFWGLALGGCLSGILLSIFFYQRSLRWCQKHGYVDKEFFDVLPKTKSRLLIAGDLSTHPSLCFEASANSILEQLGIDWMSKCGCTSLGRSCYSSKSCPWQRHTLSTMVTS
jgi:hypothetical protein